MNFYERNEVIARNERLDPLIHFIPSGFLCGYCLENEVKECGMVCEGCQEILKELK